MFHNLRKERSVRKTKKKPRPKPRFPLAELLHLHGWSQRKLARASGMDEQRVSDLVRGRHQPTWPTILRICTTIGADLGDLAPGKGGAA
jgi:transcriptional regulator with XRE-family HTH domain